MSNPFSLVHDKLWELAEGHEGTSEYPALTSLVKLGNRIKLDKRQSPLKGFIQNSDVPELLLVPDGGSPELNRNSSDTAIIRNYSWIISTGDMRVSEVLYPVEFALFVAMSNYCQVLKDLTFEGNRFIQRVRTPSIIHGESDENKNRNIKGWSALWTCEVFMTFKIETLKDIYDGNE